jgi:putative transcriptional regulator
MGARYATLGRCRATFVAMQSELAPALLVAMEPIVDPNFRRTVILMLEHDPEQGALGLVLNRGTDVPMAQLCENLDVFWRGLPDLCVDWGGPVQEDTGWVLLGDDDDPEAVPLIKSLRWSRSRDSLERVAREPALVARVFLGYAGWGAGQLEREITESSWLVVPVTRSLVFDTPRDELWVASVRSLGIEPATLVTSHGVN